MHYITTAHQAELNAATRMRELGFSDAHAVPAGPDGGIDVVARNAVAQVKWRSELAGRPQLQQLFGARAGDVHKTMLFFVTSGYSGQALEFANRTGMCLFRYDPTGAISPVNRFARELVVRSTQSSALPLPDSPKGLADWWLKSVKSELPANWVKEPKSVKMARSWVAQISNKRRGQ